MHSGKWQKCQDVREMHLVAVCNQMRPLSSCPEPPARFHARSLMNSGGMFSFHQPFGAPDNEQHMVWFEGKKGNIFHQNTSGASTSGPF